MPGADLHVSRTNYLVQGRRPLTAQGQVEGAARAKAAVAVAIEVELPTRAALDGLTREGTSA